MDRLRAIRSPRSSLSQRGRRGTDAATPVRSPSHSLFQLQRALGNQTVQHVVRACSVQMGPVSGRHADVYEREADRVAEHDVASAPQIGVRGRCACGGTPGPDGECAACRAKRLALQRLAGEHSGASDVPPVVSEGVRSLRQPLDPSSRGFFESRLGYDFGEVRIHSDALAAASARALNARAYTIGRDVVFGEGQYAPQTAAGNRLLAHELAHVIQQGASGERVQRKVVDNDAHVTCRPKRPGAVATLQTAEDAAIELAEGAAAWVRIMLDLDPSQLTRDPILWRRFHLDVNRRNVREELMPILVRRFELVAGRIRGGEVRYVCGPTGTQPPGECTTRPGQGNAWTATGEARTQLCETFWTGSADDQAGIILHEWFHRGFGFLGDCEAANLHNTKCYDMFARELAGTATPDDYAWCCKAPRGP